MSLYNHELPQPTAKHRVMLLTLTEVNHGGPHGVPRLMPAYDGPYRGDLVVLHESGVTICRPGYGHDQSDSVLTFLPWHSIVSLNISGEW